MTINWGASSTQGNQVERNWTRFSMRSSHNKAPP